MSVKPHDVGGENINNNIPIKLDLTEREYEFWERRIHALMTLLVSKNMLTLHEMRRGVESLPLSTYNSWGYYEKWSASISAILIERGLIQSSDLDDELGWKEDMEKKQAEPLFGVGDDVTVRKEDWKEYWRRPHLRVPGYVFGATGVVERVCGTFGDPEFMAYRSVERVEYLYRVRFRSSDLWQSTNDAGDGVGDDSASHVLGSDSVDVEIYEPWLVATSDNNENSVEPKQSDQPAKKNISLQSHDESHDHSHDHVHEERSIVEQNALQKEKPETIGKRLSEALVSLCLDKKLILSSELTSSLEQVDAMGFIHSKKNNGQRQPLGPKIVARAWIDPDFKSRLLRDANSAIQDMKNNTSDSSDFNKKPAYSVQLTAVENTPTVHNVIVCTLCSCYPLAILGLSPPWYKSRSYRARVVREPREVLCEFGTNIDDERVDVRVHDSTADLRYIVIPERPEGTEGWTEERLELLVTRDSMIGVRKALSVEELMEKREMKM